MARVVFRITLSLAAAALVSCESSPPPYQYQFENGKTAIITPRGAAVPVNAPAAVQRAVAAGNHIAGLPYIYGGGHRILESPGYDCSGTASYLMVHAGFLKSPIASDEFRHFGESGPGKWITIYARRGHVFTVIAGLRMDTGFNGQGEGPRWSTRPRPAKGFVLRHPPGL